MRHSTARLADSSVRLADLDFPHDRVHIHRTRIMFIHLDHLLHFAKMDRAGRTDGYVAAYLPDELVTLLLEDGELVAATAMSGQGRAVVPIATALKRIRQEEERGELTFCDAPLEQLAWMYASCAAPAARRYVDPAAPEGLFPALSHEIFTGVLELITNGHVGYFRFEDGRLLAGYYGSAADRVPLDEHVRGLLAPTPNGPRPQVAAAVFPAADTVPPQAAPAMIQTYRELFWAIAARAEQEVEGEGTKRAYRLRDQVAQEHPSLRAVGTPLDRDPLDVVATPNELMEALARWTRQLLEELEVIAPGVAPVVVRDATREHRFMLQRAGFYDQLPWTVSW